MPNLWQRIKSGFRSADVQQDARTDGEADAKKRLDDMRENELSLGAAMRRGASANTAPAQPSRPMSSWDKIGTQPVQVEGGRTALTRPTSQRPGSSSTSTGAGDSGFLIGLAVGTSIGGCEPSNPGGTDTACSGTGD